MSRVHELSGTAKPSALFKNMQKHRGNPSEGSSHRLIGTRTVLGKKVQFFSDGTRKAHGIRLSEEEEYGSQILRLTHASLLVNEPVGDKRKFWVDATKNPVEIWIDDKPMSQFVSECKVAIRAGIVDPKFVADENPDRVSLEMQKLQKGVVIL